MKSTYWYAGWERPVEGFYARGVWRIQRLSTGWNWWCVYNPGMPHVHAGKQGKEATLKAAKAAVDAQEGPPPNARTIKDNPVTGAISREAAQRAVKEVMERRHV
jgi:hypothetical protein